ncbi:MAG: hypothetical protein ABSD49_14505 [Candidatus Bathyarchaeia archaeon]
MTSLYAEWEIVNPPPWYQTQPYDWFISAVIGAGIGAIIDRVIIDRIIDRTRLRKKKK